MDAAHAKLNILVFPTLISYSLDQCDKMKIVVPQKHTFAQVIGPKVSFQFYETIKRVRYLWCYKINTVFDWEFMQSKYGTKP